MAGRGFNDIYSSQKFMILTFLFYVLTIFLSLLVGLLPTWTLWPADLTTSLNYFFSVLAKLNFLFPVDTLFAVILFVIGFEILYFTAKIVLKIINFFRGASGIDI